jgi:hypothetical protein
MRCESCGKDLAEGAAFCPECGERSPAMSAREIVDLAHTGGLVRGRAAGQVPDMPEDPELPDDVPDLPEAAPLPEAPGMEIPGGEVASAGVRTGFLDKARVREEKRRAAQALVESAQQELREELTDIPDKESLIAERGYDVDDVYSDVEPPPPPPQSATERMMEETRERAERHGVDLPMGAGGGPEGTTSGRETSPLEEKVEELTAEQGSNCCSVGCVAGFVLLFVFFLIGFLMNFVQ